MTASEYAEREGIPYQTVVRWARKKLIPGVKVTEFGRFKIYMIPEDAKVERPKTGRPKKAAKPAKSSKKGGAAK